MKNEEKIKNLLIEKTNYNKDENEIILNILKSHSIIGRKNKEKFIQSFMNELKISKEEANQLYNICMEILIKNLI